VSPEDLDVFYKTDSVDEAFEYLTTKLEAIYAAPEGLDQIKLT
jgi:hypothetical protein